MSTVTDPIADFLSRVRNSTQAQKVEMFVPYSKMKSELAPRYPKLVKAYGRVMSLEDLLTVHGPDKTGRAFAMESDDNIHMTTRIKMASNGMPVAALMLASEPSVV